MPGGRLLPGEARADPGVRVPATRFGRRGPLFLQRAGPRGIEVDELWPSAAGGAGAAAAANESKAADGDMDCDSDSDLGSRISLHAPM